MGGWLPVAGAAVFALVVGVQGYTIAEVSGDRASEIPASDRASETRHKWDAVFSSALPSSTRFALHNASYFLGQGSAGIQWSYDNLGSVDSRALSELNETADADVHENYAMSLEGKCSIPQDFSYHIDTLHTPSADSTDQLTARIRAQNTRVQCDLDSIHAYEPEAEYVGKVTSLDNRYLRMVENLKQYHSNLRGELSERVDSRYSDSERFCGYPERDEIQGVEEDADQKVFDDIKSAFDAAEPGFPSWLSSVSRRILPNSDRLDYGTSTTKYTTESDSTRVPRDGCCISNPRGGCSTYYYDVISEIQPANVQTAIRAEDTEYRIPVPRPTRTSPQSIGSGAGEWRNLQVFVEEYTQHLQKD